jgi:uncharacterized protein with ParB-like and HNH nuclease domain
MSQPIKAEVKNLRAVFGSPDSFYQIPDFQRPYSWNAEHISQLIEDLFDAFNDNMDEYFCGSLVLAKNVEDNRLDVIDGQQRLTTFTILLCVFRDIYKGFLNEAQKTIISRCIRDFQGSTEKERLRFRTDDTMQLQFEEKILREITFTNKNPKKDSNKYLQNAYLLKVSLDEKFEDEEKKNDSEKGMLKFFEWLLESVKLTIIETQDLDGAIRIFSILNDRGMPLAPMDILKSSLIQNITENEQRTSFKATWNKIENSFENSNGEIENMFSIYSVFKQPKTTKERYDKIIRRVLKDEKKTTAEAIIEIEKFAKSYIEIIDDKKKDRRIYLCRYLSHWVYWQSIITTAHYSSYDNFDKLLDVLVAYFYQNWIAGATINRIKQTSMNIIIAIKDKKTIGEIKKICNDNLSKYKTTDEYKNELDSGIYNKTWGKSLLLLIEYFMKDDSCIDFIPIEKKLQIEHILPQTPGVNSDWKEIFTNDEREKYTDSLGNLTLLSDIKNIQALNFSFDKKKSTYENGNGVTSSFIITQRILKESKWDKNAIENRRNSLFGILEEHLEKPLKN